jgi:cellulose synthase/poly-beta-1,6-N-acetylglucosamine synthase-like glycosyltransferase
MTGIPEIILMAITLVAALPYAGIMRSFAMGWKRLESYSYRQVEPDTFVSIVVPFRNERDNLKNLLDQLSRQSYPIELMEVIFVDDFSDDGGREVIRNYPGLQCLYKVITLKDTGMREGSKKRALETGIREAQGELIITTDADISFGTLWVNSIENYYRRTGCKLIWGPVLYKAVPGFWKGFYSLDFTGLVASAAGAAGIQKAFMCNGANMAFQKSAYDETGGYKGNERFLSGDDVFLLHKVKKRYGNDQVSFIKDPDAVVTTDPPQSLAGFINQRSRWASKSSGYADRTARYVTGTVYLFHLLLLLNFPAGFYNPWLFLFFALMLVIKGLLERSLIRGFSSFFNLDWGSRYFWVYALIYVPYIVLTGILAMTGIYRWKGR